MRSRTASCWSTSLRSATPTSWRPRSPTALGVVDRPGQERAEALTAYLRDRRALLVLDNFEQLVAAAPLLAELLTAARPADAPRHEPLAARPPRGADLLGAGARASRSVPDTTAGQARRESRQFGCSSSAPATRGPTSSSPRRTPTRWPSSADAWTGCRSRSSSQPRGSSCSPRVQSSSVSAAGSTS